ncbi:hypothetical protein ABXJ14_01750 [Morganella morganii]|uniref:hypothetical protein n=1 Tax=Morganella morganii TaxID=582 RepID=UPI00339C9024
MSWTEIKDGVPEKNVECFVIREWADGSLHSINAARKSSQPLTIDNDMSRNAWWHSLDGEVRFSDSTVVAWMEIKKIAPAHKGQLVPYQ